MHARSGSFLFLRSGLVTAVMLALAAGAHVIGGGVLPAVGVLIGLTALALLPVTVLALRQVDLRTAVAALGIGQIVLHHAFSAFAAAGTCDGAAGSGQAGHAGTHPVGAAHSQHDGGAPLIASAALHCAGAASHLASGLTGGLTGSLTGSDAIMTAAHACAVLATAAVIARGEHALVLLLAWLAPLLLPLVPTTPASAGPLRAPFDVVCPVLPRRNGPTRSLRGPPRPATATA